MRDWLHYVMNPALINVTINANSYNAVTTEMATPLGEGVATTVTNMQIHMSLVRDNMTAFAVVLLAGPEDLIDAAKTADWSSYATWQKYDQLIWRQLKYCSGYHTVSTDGYSPLQKDFDMNTTSARRLEAYDRMLLIFFGKDLNNLQSAMHGGYWLEYDYSAA